MLFSNFIDFLWKFGQKFRKFASFWGLSPKASEFMKICWKSMETCNVLKISTNYERFLNKMRLLIKIKVTLIGYWKALVILWDSLFKIQMRPSYLFQIPLPSPLSLRTQARSSRLSYIWLINKWENNKSKRNQET